MAQSFEKMKRIPTKTELMWETDEDSEVEICDDFSEEIHRGLIETSPKNMVMRIRRPSTIGRFYINQIDCLQTLIESDFGSIKVLQFLPITDIANLLSINHIIQRSVRSAQFIHSIVIHIDSTNSVQTFIGRKTFGILREKVNIDVIRRNFSLKGVRSLKISLPQLEPSPIVRKTLDCVARELQHTRNLLYVRIAAMFTDHCIELQQLQNAVMQCPSIEQLYLNAQGSVIQCDLICKLPRYMQSLELGTTLSAPFSSILIDLPDLEKITVHGKILPTTDDLKYIFSRYPNIGMIGPDLPPLPDTSHQTSVSGSVSQKKQFSFPPHINIAAKPVRVLNLTSSPRDTSEDFQESVFSNLPQGLTKLVLDDSKGYGKAFKGWWRAVDSDALKSLNEIDLRFLRSNDVVEMLRNRRHELVKVRKFKYKSCLPQQQIPKMNKFFSEHVSVDIRGNK